jgi:hypothetical protein
VIETRSYYSNISSYFARNFQLATPKEKKMSVSKPFLAIAVPANMTIGSFVTADELNRMMDSTAPFVANEQLEGVQRQVSTMPDRSFVVLQVVAIIEPESKPTHRVRMV